MSVKSLIAILLSCLSLSASAEHLFVTPEDVIFSGTVTAVSDGDALLAGSVSVGDSVSGFYELVRPDKNDLRFEEVKGTGSALVEEVDYGSRCGDLQVSVGGTFELGAGGVDVTITDFAAGDGSDLYTARATGRAARAAPDLPFDVQAELLLQDASGEAAEPKQALPRPGDACGPHPRAACVALVVRGLVLILAGRAVEAVGRPCPRRVLAHVAVQAHSGGTRMILADRTVGAPR